MDDSSLCLENLWHDAGLWLPYVLGINYYDPEKLIVDSRRFSVAYKLGNLIDAEFDTKRNREPQLLEEQFLHDGTEAAKRLAMRGANKLKIATHAKEMGISERSHLKYRNLYQDVWEQIKLAFSQQRTYRTDTLESLPGARKIGKIKQDNENRKDKER
jgi:hypothetical protein